MYYTVTIVAFRSTHRDRVEVFQRKTNFNGCVPSVGHQLTVFTNENAVESFTGTVVSVHAKELAGIARGYAYFEYVIHLDLTS